VSVSLLLVVMAALALLMLLGMVVLVVWLVRRTAAPAPRMTDAPTEPDPEP
jgi:flagellar biogenesis protein FliO